MIFHPFVNNILLIINEEWEERIKGRKNLLKQSTSKAKTKEQICCLKIEFIPAQHPVYVVL